MLSYQFQKGKYFADQASQIGNNRLTSEKQKSLRTYLKLYDNLWLQPLHWPGTAYKAVFLLFDRTSVAGAVLQRA